MIEEWFTLGQHSNVTWVSLLLIAITFFTFGCINQQENDPYRDGELATLPAFEGGVAKAPFGKMAPIVFTQEQFTTAVNTFAQDTNKNMGLRSAAVLLELSSFALVEGWQGHLNEKSFRLDIYHGKEYPFSLIVLAYPDNHETKVTLVGEGPLHAFVFYGESVRFTTGILGAMGPALNLSVGQVETVSNDQAFESLREAFVSWQKKQGGPYQSDFIERQFELDSYSVVAVGPNTLFIKATE